MRCYFHLVNCHDVILDDTGVEVDNLDSAEAEARKAIQELRQEDGDPDDLWAGWQLSIVDASGRVLLSISLTTPLH
ncbi:DUF6894 family protein [Microvirga yunnanensis]|uniref:DUF6894 family protein n=1 Tax=Microvirga yunnanensis TaxID=2953740 RepID=UPI0021C7693F|nr:hypothetical protein [Microvirga sp. HBU65207]